MNEATIKDISKITARFEIAPSGCWLWIKSVNNGGYSNFNFGQKTFMVHRFMYTLLRGKIPEGKDLDHLCRTRRCINPTHLEAVTRQENINRGIGPKILKNRHDTQTHCKYGHLLSEDNVYRWGKLQARTCKACYRAHTKKRYSA